MSKKMVKRSLALGALMAFVITGQAWAADIGISKNYEGTEVFKGTSGSTLTLGGGEYLNSYWIRPVEYKSLTVSGYDKIIYTGDATDDLNSVFISYGYGKNISELNINNVGSIETKDNNNQKTLFFNAFGAGITIQNIDTISIKNAGYAFVARDCYADSSIVVKDVEQIVVEGGRAVWADGAKADVSLAADNIEFNTTNSRGILNKNSAVVDIKAKENLIIELNSGYIESSYSAQTDLKSKYITIIGNGDKIISSLSGSEVNIGKNDNLVKANITGNIEAKDTSVVNIKLGTNGSFVGSIDKDDSSTVNIGLGSNSTLNVSSGTGEQKVTTLSGVGTVVVGNDDKLIVHTKDASLTVQEAGVTADTVEDQKAHLDALAEAVVDETGKSVADTLLIEEGEIVGAVTADVKGGAIVAGSVKEAVNTVNKSIGEASVVGMAHIRAHMNDMNKRMGELRMANGEAGIWTRMVRGEEEFAGAKSQYNQYQLGYDEKLSVDKRWTVGAAVTFAEGNGNFANGSTENDSTAFAIYGSKLNNDGTFVDLIARYARFESDITVADAKSDYSTNGMSVSAEFGKRIQQGNGLWIEPQFELTYGSVDSAEYKLGDKTVQVGDMDSLIGRVGFSLGKDIKQGNVYARASYLYDFDGETETTFGNGSVTRTIEEDLGGGWFEVGVGANINLSKATYIYADVEKTFGGEVDTNWKWNLGVRYSF